MSFDLFTPVQARKDNDTRSFILNDHPKLLHKAVFFADGSRSIDLETFTLLAKIVATGKLTSFIDETATDGTAIPSAIYLGPTIAAAKIVSGDIVDIVVLIGQTSFDNTRLIIENSKTLQTIIATGSVNARTVEDQLRMFGLYAVPTITSSGLEN